MSYKDLKKYIHIPIGEYCNEPCQTGCQFLEGVARIGRCFCRLFEKYLKNKYEDYTVCAANYKCEDCLRLEEGDKEAKV